MHLSKEIFSSYIKKAKFKELFNDMGWNNDKTSKSIIVDSEEFKLLGIAEKSGFKILECQHDKKGNIPLYSIRRKIENRITRLFQEHLIIFTDKAKEEQIWQLAHRQSGKPIKITETRYSINQNPQLLYQRTTGFIFELDEEDKITIIDVAARVTANFQQNNEKVTKEFYDRFKKEHTSFLKFIKGIDDKANKEWYASLMLNRLMFCYFIQKKGFLDSNTNYLRDKLKFCKEKKGKGKFFSFYKNFLIILFHKGLGAPDHSPELREEIGKIPYLNGGLFDEHELEKSYSKIDMDDEAFERIFDFFDKYEWHLDTRHTASGRDINPDVIGYIFEKYINDRAQMGAYYTKEDITDYISKNCIIPFLFDETKRNYSKPFSDGGEVWEKVQEGGDKYIYDAVKKGTDICLPKDIVAGIKEVKKRSNWNKPTPDDFALPTEVWRETVDRRRKFEDVKSKILNGEIKSINDFITYNLNIRQFAIDCIAETDDPEFLKEFYKSLNSVTILDPTCGSGAFLFAAMNILEELYEQSIQRMQTFVSEEKKGKHKFFEDILKQVQSPEHPNLQYFIYKSIILRNLYGVDIMKEAIEIAKLRLFLKLVATVEPNYRKPNLGLEPLPDIDFNIRSGNTLVGFATEQQLEDGIIWNLDGQLAAKKIKENCEIVAKTFDHYKEIQLNQGENLKSFKKAKEELNSRLKELNCELNMLLHKQYQGIKYSKWLESYKPFHWFAEYYEILKNGGFDVIVGNPPYLSLARLDYEPERKEFNCNDLYGFVIKRCFNILRRYSRHGFIVMHNLAFSKNFSDLRFLIKSNASNAWFSFYARIPAGLFTGDVRVRNCIYVLEKTENSKVKTFHTTRIYRWIAEARPNLIFKISYTNFDWSNIIPMYNSSVLSQFFATSKGKPLSYYESSSSKNKLYYKQSAYNWIAVSEKPAPCYDSKGRKISQSKVGSIEIAESKLAQFSLLFLSGKLFFCRWLTFGDEFDVTKDDLVQAIVPFEDLNLSDKQKLVTLYKAFMKTSNLTIQYKTNAGKKVGTYNTSKQWNITDDSDKIFLKYLCENSEDVLTAIDDHVFLTLTTRSIYGSDVIEKENDRKQRDTEDT